MRRHVNIYALRIPKVVMDIFKDVKKDCFQVVRRRCVVCFGTRVNQCMYKDFHQPIATKLNIVQTTDNFLLKDGKRDQPLHYLFISLFWTFKDTVNVCNVFSNYLQSFCLKNFHKFIWRIWMNWKRVKAVESSGIFCFKKTWIPNGSIKVSINTYSFYFL